MHCRTSSIPVHPICLVKTSGTLQPLGQPKQHPPHFSMFCTRGSSVPTEKSRHRVMRKHSMVVPEVQCAVGCSVPCLASICGLRDIYPSLVLRSSPDHSPGQTRNLDHSSSRTSNTTAQHGSLQTHALPGFNVTNAFLGPETVLLPPNPCPTVKCGSH